MVTFSSSLQISKIATAVWNRLKKTVRCGPRRTVPSFDEIYALRSNIMQQVIIFFLDGAFEELKYDMSTTGMMDICKMR